MTSQGKESPSDIFIRDEKKSDEFAELLEKIEYAANETKRLWKEIYENANDDRTRALLLFGDLYRAVVNSSDAHALHGKLLSQYLERMNKSNDQLLKLAELIESASDIDTAIDAEALYDEINKK